MKRSNLFITTALLAVSTAASAQAAPFCREYSSQVMIGNRVQESIGTACLNPDGSWQVVSGDNVGASFYDNGPNGNGSNSVSFIQPVPVYYNQPVNYVWRERVYYPSSTVVINGYGYDRHWKRPRTVYRPYYMSYNNRPPHGHAYGHDHDRGPGRGRDREHRH